MMDLTAFESADGNKNIDPSRIGQGDRSAKRHFRSVESAVGLFRRSPMCLSDAHPKRKSCCRKYTPVRARLAQSRSTGFAQ